MSVDGDFTRHTEQIMDALAEKIDVSVYFEAEFLDQDNWLWLTKHDIVQCFRVAVAVAIMLDHTEAQQWLAKAHIIMQHTYEDAQADLYGDSRDEPWMQHAWKSLESDEVPVI